MARRKEGSFFEIELSNGKYALGAAQLQNIYTNPDSATRGQLAAIMRYYFQGDLNNDDK